MKAYIVEPHISNEILKTKNVFMLIANTSPLV